MINDVNATLEDSCGDNLNGVDRFGNGEKTNFSLDVETTTANMDVGSSSEFAASQESPTAPVPPERRHVSDTREGSCGDNRNGDDSWNDNETGVEEKMGSPDIESTTQDSTTTVVSQEISPPPPPSRNCCGRMWHYGDSGNMSEARGYALLAMGRGVAVMGNVVVSVALVELATEAAGCEMGADECTGKVYGLNPVSLISGIPVVSGVLGAFFMPIIGVILDFTPYRRFVGILFSVVFTVIQAIQIAIGEKTWFAMAILQAIAGFCFIINVLTTIAYLPEICEQVGQLRHAQYTSRFTGKQFSMQASFLILVSVLSYVLKMSDDSVQTARMCQALNFTIISIFFGLGWQRMPPRKATRELPEGMRGFRILAYGIRQNIRTAASIHRDYKKGLSKYLLATMFAQAGVAALTSTSVVYLSTEVGLNATDTLIFFLVVLIGTIPGTKLASLISKRVNPSTSWQLSMLSLFIAIVIGAFTLGDAASKYLSLVWGFIVGIVLGWFYPTENLFFSCILPKGQEAEIAGFRVYCSTILSWVPPLIFSALVENEIDPKWGMTFMGSFILIAALLLKFAAGTWEEILKESGRTNLSVSGDLSLMGGLSVGVDLPEREAAAEPPL